MNTTVEDFSKQSSQRTGEQESTKSRDTKQQLENSTNSNLSSLDQEQLKEVLKSTSKQALKEAKKEFKKGIGWGEDVHVCLNWLLFFWLFASFYIPGVSQLNKWAWQPIYYGLRGAETFVEETTEALAPKVDTPVEEGDKIGQCIVVTSGIKDNRTITVGGKTVTRAHPHIDFAPSHECYNKVPAAQHSELHKVFAVGDQGDKITVECMAAATTGGYGNLAIMKNHTQGFYIKYAHLQDGSCTPTNDSGYQFGSKNHLIGLMGTTGWSTGIHLDAGVYDLATNERWNYMPLWIAYAIFDEPFDPLIQRGEKNAK